MRHTCHAIDCPVPVPPAKFMCGPHWFKLPRAMRNEIYRLYRPGQEADKQPTEAYLEVTYAARHFIHKREGKPGKLCVVCIRAG